MRIPANWYPRLIVSFLLSGIAFTIRHYIVEIDISLVEDLGISVVMFLVLVLVWTFFANINSQLDKYIPFDKNTSLRITIQIILGVTLILIVRLTGMYSMRERLPFEPEPIIIATIIGLDIFLALTINLAVISHYLIKRWKESILKTEKLEQERIQLQYHTLRNQVNPHFLFNSFASLQGMINSNPEAASRYVSLLAKVYRYAIGNNEKIIVPLYTEIEMFNNYREVMNLRYGNSLQIHIQIPEAIMEKGIVHMALQNLVENAIKHNEIHSEKPLIIDIYMDENGLVISNNVQHRANLKRNNGTGLTQLKRLYSYYSEIEFMYGQNDGKYQVHVPLLNTFEFTS
jgi:two-component system, LytTR family, sensor kinase